MSIKFFQPIPANDKIKSSIPDRDGHYDFVGEELGEQDDFL